MLIHLGGLRLGTWMRRLPRRHSYKLRHHELGTAVARQTEFSATSLAAALDYAIANREVGSTEVW